MINPTYYIDISKKDKNEESPILANVTTNYVKTSCRVGKVKSRHWNKTKQRVSPPRITEDDNNHEEINSHLYKLQTDSKKYFLECR